LLAESPERVLEVVYRALQLAQFGSEAAQNADAHVHRRLLILHLHFGRALQLHESIHRAANVDPAGLAAEGVIDVGKNAGNGACSAQSSSLAAFESAIAVPQFMRAS